MKYLLLVLVFILNLQLNAQQENQIYYVYFDSGGATISPGQITSLDEFMASVASFHVQKVELNGHADEIGSIESNLLLSKNRVDAVYSYLNDHEIELSNFSFEYYGESSPITDNGNEVGRSKNRRVELILHIQTDEIFDIGEITEVEQEVIAEATKIDSSEILSINYGDPFDVLSEFRSEAQRFCIDSKRDTAIQGVNGTILFFQAGNFAVKEDINSCIEIQLREFYSPEDIILNNLNTQSGDGFLETKGAINVEAYYDGKLISLRRNKRINLYFPNIGSERGYRLFNGKETAGRFVDWEENLVKPINLFANAEMIPCHKRKYMLCRWFCEWRNGRFLNRSYNRQKKEFKAMEAKYGEINLVEYGTDLSNRSLNLFPTTKMGYLNCDRFMRYPESGMKSFYVGIKQNSREQNMASSIVLKRQKAVLTGRMDEKGRHWFVGVPANEKVWLVVIKKEAEVYFLSIKEHVLSDEPVEHLDFKIVTEKELKASLRKISW